MIKIDTSGFDKLSKALDDTKDLKFNLGELLIKVIGEEKVKKFEADCESNNIVEESEDFYSNLNTVIRNNSKFNDLEEVVKDYYFSILLGKI